MAMAALKAAGWPLDERKVAAELQTIGRENLLKAKGKKKQEELEAILLNASALLSVHPSTSFLQWDFSAISAPVLPARPFALDGPLVLQLAAWRNVSHSALKEHRGNTGVCRLSLTDGHSTIDGFSTRPLDKLDGKTPLRAKVLLDGRIPTEGGLLVLTPEKTRLLGGQVDGLRRAEANETLSNGLPNAPKWTSVASSEEKERELVERDWAHFESRSVLPNTPWNPSNPPRPDDPETAEFKRRRKAAIAELVVPPKRRRLVHGRFQR